MWQKVSNISTSLLYNIVFIMGFITGLPQRNFLDQNIQSTIRKKTRIRIVYTVIYKNWLTWNLNSVSKLS